MPGAVPPITRLVTPIRQLVWWSPAYRASVSAMALAGLAWQTLPEPGALALVDTVSRRAAALTRPRPADLSITDVAAVEQIVLAWLDPATRAGAEGALHARLAADQLGTLRAVCWLLALWAVILHLRTGEQPTDVLAGLSFNGVWRGPQAPETERIWEMLTDQVRTGALAALTDDEPTAAAFRASVIYTHGLAECLLHHSLVLMAGLWAVLVAHGLEPRDMAGTLALYTLDAADPPTGSFRPLA